MGELIALCERVYWSPRWLRVLPAKLSATHGNATVYALVFHNITESIASQLHNALKRKAPYLGALEVDFSYGPHLVFFRNLIGVQYRMEGTRCSVFYHMSDTEDGRFDSQLAEAREYGFLTVDWEDRGAHGTIFDDYDTLEHFKRLEAFRRAIAPLVSGGEDQASELIFLLEDLNPRIIWTLAAAFSALEKAQTEEDVAQASLSGRRFIEQLADVLFPPKDVPQGARPLGKPNYRNRIWAYLADHASADETRAYGNEVDRLDEEFNAGLHGSRGKPRLEQAFTDLAVLTTAVLSVDPSAARNPYYAHRERILELFRKHL